MIVWLVDSVGSNHTCVISARLHAVRDPAESSREPKSLEHLCPSPIKPRHLMCISVSNCMIRVGTTATRLSPPLLFAIRCTTRTSQSRCYCSIPQRMPFAVPGYSQLRDSSTWPFPVFAFRGVSSVNFRRWLVARFSKAAAGECAERDNYLSFVMSSVQACGDVLPHGRKTI